MKSPSCRNHNEIVGKQVLPYDSVVMVVGQPDNQPNYEWLTDPMTEAHLDFDCSEDFVTFIGDNVAQARVKCGTNQVLKSFQNVSLHLCVHVNLNSVLINYSSSIAGVMMSNCIPYLDTYIIYTYILYIYIYLNNHIYNLSTYFLHRLDASSHPWPLICGSPPSPSPDIVCQHLGDPQRRAERSSEVKNPKKAALWAFLLVFLSFLKLRVI